MNGRLDHLLRDTLAAVREAGTYPDEHVLHSPQGANICVATDKMINLSSNDYLGLSNHQEVLGAAIDGLRERGFGTASVRLLSGTLDIHKELELCLSEFLHTESTILYSSCYHANLGIFASLLKEEDVVLSDELNHASIIDGIRLCDASKRIYKHCDMGHLEEELKASNGSRLRLIVTDGVFSMDGDFAPLDVICDLADQYDAAVMVDDSHATGVVGLNGLGSQEKFNVIGKIDILTSTLGKALGGAGGGFVSGSQLLVNYLRMASRPYVFSNSVSPPIVAASLRILELMKEFVTVREGLRVTALRFRQLIKSVGFITNNSDHPIIPIMLGDDETAYNMAKDLWAEGILVIGIRYPVVPKGQARIRVQISVEHSEDDIRYIVDAFTRVGKRHAVIH